MNSYLSAKKNLLYFANVLPSDIRCGITTRLFDCCNYYHPREKILQEQNIRRLAQIFGAKKIIAPIPKTIQGTEIFIADEVEKKTIQKVDGDAVIMPTNFWKNERPMLIHPTGDCPIIILHDKQSWTVIHGGWRGLQGDIITKTIERLKSFHFKRKEARVIIWPGVCQEHYEVGEEFQDFFPEYYIDHHINLAKIIREQLMKNGIPEHHITTPKWCSFHSQHNGEPLFSSLRRGDKIERNVVFITKCKLL